jgi:uncharacterized protein (TIGR02145 family)
MKNILLVLGTSVMITLVFDSCGGNNIDDVKSSKVSEPSKITLASNEVAIGKQIWMNKNLSVTKFRNGDPIPEVKFKSKLEWQKASNELTQRAEPAWCYYNFDSANGEKYGILYNWYAVNDPRGLAPIGYHIPSKTEWEELQENLGGVWNAGKQMKSNKGWKAIGDFEYNANGTNSSKFSALPGGEYNFDATCTGLGIRGNWWSSTIERGDVWYISLTAPNDHINWDKVGNKKICYSVRCIKD